MRRHVLLAASALIITDLASAQPANFGQAHATRPVRLMIGGGATVPVGDLGKRYNDGYNLQGSLLIRLAGLPINLRTDINYSRLKLNDLLSLYSDSYSSASAKLWGGLANVTLPLGSGPVRPYFMAGLGAFSIDPAKLSTEDVESSVSFAVNGGAGVHIRVLGLETFIEVRVNNVYTDKGIVDTKGIQVIPLTFGLVF